MERKETETWRKWDWAINAVLVTAVLFIMAPMAWGLDIQDITVEWTEAGKTIAAERVAKWKTKDDIVLVPAGEFVMGSDKKTDRLAYWPIGARSRSGASIWMPSRSVSTK